MDSRPVLFRVAFSKVRLSDCQLHRRQQHRRHLTSMAGEAVRDGGDEIRPGPVKSTAD